MSDAASGCPASQARLALRVGYPSRYLDGDVDGAVAAGVCGPSLSELEVHGEEGTLVRIVPEPDFLSGLLALIPSFGTPGVVAGTDDDMAEHFLFVRDGSRVAVHQLEAGTALSKDDGLLILHFLGPFETVERPERLIERTARVASMPYERWVAELLRVCDDLGHLIAATTDELIERLGPTLDSPPDAHTFLGLATFPARVDAARAMARAVLGTRS